MKILYITEQLYLHGGVESVTSMKLNYFSDLGHDVYLSTYKQDGKPFVYPISEKVHYENLSIGYDFDHIRIRTYSIRQIKLIPKHIYLTAQLIKDIKPDIIIVPYQGFEFLFLPFIKQGAKIVKEYHNSLCHLKEIKIFSLEGLMIGINRLILKLYDAIVVLTPNEKDFIHNYKNVSVIPNPIVPSRYISSLSSARIISVGRIAPVKQFDILIEIANCVYKKNPDIRFEIYGEGDEIFKEALLKKIDYYGLENVFFLMGQTNNVLKIMAESSIYVCTSSEESFGVSIVEAQSCGLPVVSFDCPYGPRNIIHNGVDGVLVEQNSVEDFCSEICNLLSNPDLRKKMGASALKNTYSYHINKIGQLWLDLFTDLCK